MEGLLTEAEGKMALELARNAINEYLATERIIKPGVLTPAFKEKRGVFVTLNSGSRRELRGCIGRPYPIMPLDEAIIISAINAATEDPRFRPVAIREMGNISLEVTILTLPNHLKVKPAELPGKIEVGRHGLIVRQGPYSGLLLPQVAVEHGFDAREFLSQTCMKAGLYPDCWIDTDTEVYLFEGQIFHEA